VIIKFNGDHGPVFVVASQVASFRAAPYGQTRIFFSGGRSVDVYESLDRVRDALESALAESLA
jgi:hypothetical protein